MKNIKNSKLQCFLCGNTSNFVSLKKAGYCDTHNYLCKKCGLVFIPRNENSTHTYYKRDGYFKKSPALSVRKQLVSRSMLISIGERQIKKSLNVKYVDFTGKSILDVGCAYGENLYYLKKMYNSNVLGLEPSPEASVLGDQMFNVKIVPALLEEFKPRKKFDIIICNHTLEHVDDPHTFLKGLKELLKKDGLLYIEVPNIFKPSGGYSLNTFLYEEHLQNFNVFTLSKLLAKNGISPIVIEDKDYLRCWSTISKRNEIKCKPIGAQTVLNFLKTYKKNYSYRDLLGVYLDKGKYTLSLLIHKALDIKHSLSYGK